MLWKPHWIDTQSIQWLICVITHKYSYMRNISRQRCRHLQQSDLSLHTDKKKTKTKKNHISSLNELTGNVTKTEYSVMNDQMHSHNNGKNNLEFHQPRWYQLNDQIKHYWTMTYKSTSIYIFRDNSRVALDKEVTSSNLERPNWKFQCRVYCMKC